MADRSLIGERDFTADAASVCQARRYVLSLLDLHGTDHEPTELTESVQLAVSELATNAVLHARTPFRVRVTRDSTTLRVAVYDPSPIVAAKKAYGPAAVTGRGLTIVEQVTDDWGVIPEGAGKWVWFDVTLVGEAVR